MNWNTSYGIRPVDLREAIKLFGSAARALEATGGDASLLLLYINNPGRVADAPAVYGHKSAEYHGALLEAIRDEEERALCNSIRAAWASIDGRKTLAEVSRSLGIDPRTARRRLVAMGLRGGSV